MAGGRCHPLPHLGSTNAVSALRVDPLWVLYPSTEDWQGKQRVQRPKTEQAMPVLG